MSRGVGRQAGLLALSLLGFLARPVAADTVANYRIRGSGATVFWGLEQGSIDQDVVVFAFNDLAPVEGDKPPPGPRVIFSVTRWSVLGFTVIGRQWFGDAPLKADALVVSPGLEEAKLEAELTGTFEERLSPGGATRREGIKGTLKVHWVANAEPANTTLAINSQATPVAVQLDAVGQGRRGQATVEVNVPGLIGPFQIVGPGTLLSPSVGSLTLKLQ